MSTTIAPGQNSGPLRRYGLVAALVAVIVVVGIVGAALRGGNATKTIAPGTSSLPLTFQRAAETHRQIDFGAGCDPATGRLKVPTMYAAPCVAPFKGDNGGHTFQGVTSTTIVVAVYEAAPDLLQEATLAAGGSGDTTEQVRATLQGYVDFFQAHYETYGRKVKLVPVKASGGGADDAAAKADAINVATDIKAFASFGGPQQTDVYAAELAARHVLCIGCTVGTTDPAVRARAPYLWGFQPTPEQSNLLTAEFVGKRLKGGNAIYAGDAAMQRHPRVFGLLAYDTFSGTFGPTRADLARQLSNEGVTLATTANYLLDINQAQEVARTLITKLKGAGVTTVIDDTDPFGPLFLTTEAAKQSYFPEWIVTGSELTDTAVFSRLYDQRVWAHAFGISELPGRVNEVNSDPFKLFMWQTGQKPPAESTYPLIYPNPFIFFTGIHLAGPKLTPETFRDALWSYPPSGGGPTNPLLSFGRHGFWPNDDYVGFDDAAEIWWDPKAVGEDEIGRRSGIGLYHYVNAGRRYRRGQFPSEPLHAFDPTGTVTIFDPPPDKAPPYPAPHSP